jgi:serine/threonine-protein kinase SRPK3
LTDLTSSNVLLELAPIHHWTDAQIYERLGAPNTVKLVRTPHAGQGDSAPNYVVEPAWIPDVQYLTHNATLIDFSETFTFAQPPKHEDIGIPLMFRAPETIFESILNLASEAWSLACVLYEIRAGDHLFTSLMGGNDEIIQQMVQIKGKLPDKWWNSWTRRSTWFNEDGKPVKRSDGGPNAVEYPLEEVIAEIGCYDDEAAMFGAEVSMLEAMNTTVPEKEAGKMKDFLESALKWCPKERLSVRQMLEHPWVSEV